jgi:Undecaprenyl-phosphate galactose phosphotransferase WbaP
VEELRRLTTSTSAVFIIFTGITFWIRTAEYFSHLIFAFAWIFALILVPTGRWLLRIIAVRLGAWGEPVAVAGHGPQSQRVVEFLLHRMRFGLLPAVMLDGPQATNSPQSQIPVVTFPASQDDNLPSRLVGINTAILINSELSAELADAVVNQQIFKFKHLILISDLGWIGSLGVVPYDLEGLLGLEIRQNLLNAWAQNTKRLVDILVSLVLGVILFPVMLAIGLLIRLDTPGSVFFTHRRVGKSGGEITVWKFRTMVANASQVLTDFFRDHPQAEMEWKSSQKLRHDPRVTRVGRFLRRSSLDELPQLWNVLRGEMSLVGPRPIVVDEIEHYEDGYKLYTRVHPGITGLWQVSGRGDTGYRERVRLDEYYVRNWSLWLDLYIALRTIWVVLRGEGAY